MKLIRVGLFEAIQFPQPVGVQKVIATENSPRPCIITEQPSGDLQVIVGHAQGSAAKQIVVIPVRNVAHKLYALDADEPRAEPSTAKRRGGRTQTESPSGDTTQ